MNANSWRFFENPPYGYRQALLASLGAHVTEEGTREVGVPHRRQPPSSLDSAPFCSFPETQVKVFASAFSEEGL